MIRSLVVLAALTVLLAGCASSEATTTITAITGSPPTTTEAPTTTTSAEVGPEALRASILEPGDYVTTTFEPAVLFHLVQKYPMRAFQTEHDAGLQNRDNSFSSQGQGIARYKGVSVHDWWLRLTPEEIVAEIESTESFEHESPIGTEFAGFPATVIEATAPVLGVLWNDRANPSSVTGAWWLERGQRVRLIIVETPAGSLVITIQAAAEEWDDFLPVAEEILAGISFPDMESG